MPIFARFNFFGYNNSRVLLIEIMLCGLILRVSLFQYPPEFAGSSWLSEVCGRNRVQRWNYVFCFSVGVSIQSELPPGKIQGRVFLRRSPVIMEKTKHMGWASSRPTASSPALVTSIPTVSTSTTIRATIGTPIWGCALPSSLINAT